jgi:hypothetical protein
MKPVHQILNDGRYDSEFPNSNASCEIESITHSIRKLYRISYYTTYTFTPDTRMTGDLVQSGKFKKLALGVIRAQESVSGTATVILKTNQRVAFLTCAHILSSPDTLISYFPPSSEDPINYMKSISIKDKEELFVKDIPACGPFVILAMDLENDIAIIGKKCEEFQDTSVFSYPLGHARELEWGNFVYIFGYPHGGLMVTKGIVSKSNGLDAGSFTVDALLNKGFSGGIILAIRDGSPNFELVGLVKSVSAKREYVLRPKNDVNFYYSDQVPYTDEEFVGTDEILNYGINYVVPAEDLIAFYTRNHSDLIKNGYNLDSFFHPGK